MKHNKKTMLLKQNYCPSNGFMLCIFTIFFSKLKCFFFLSRMKFFLCFLLIFAIASVAMAYPDANPFAAAGYHGFGREGGDEAAGYRAIFSGHEGGGGGQEG